MHRLQLTTHLGWLWKGLCLLGLLVTVACSSILPLGSSAQPATPQLKAVLPGQQIWKQNVSSYLFGTNDTYEWQPNNIQTQPLIQNAIRKAGFTLIRSFFPDKASDEDITKRIQTIENSGARCLGVITEIADTTFNEHLVKFLGARCQLYEFGNEPDWNNITVQTYLQLWNSEIPRLRRINPAAKFIGPVTASSEGNNNFMSDFLTGIADSKVLPDAVSFHWYPCYQEAQDVCLRHANTAKTVTQNIRALIQAILHKDLPIGITEWNYDPGNPPPEYGGNPQFITKFSTVALQAMIDGGVAFACQFDAASYSGYGLLDMFDIATNQPKPQYTAIASVIKKYKP